MADWGGVSWLAGRNLIVESPSKCPVDVSTMTVIDYNILLAVQVMSSETDMQREELPLLSSCPHTAPSHLHPYPATTMHGSCCRARQFQCGKGAG